MDETTLTEDGTVGTLDQLIEGFGNADGYLLVCMRSPRVLARLQERFQEYPNWQSKTVKKERVQFDPVLQERGATFAWEQIIPQYCGWIFEHWKLRCKRSYFLDPVLFYSNAKTIADIFGPIEAITPRVLLEWGQSVDLFCEENDLPYKATAGALAAQFLTDRRFYPRARRKVPKATNDRMRTKLPGNYCAITVHPGTGHRFTGLYYDQRRAHHYHAKIIKLPASDSLFAYGDFKRLERVSFDGGLFLDGGFYGYVCGDFSPPERRAQFMPPGWRRRGISRRFITTAEWPLLADLGVECLGLYAAWGSREADTGIPLYSAHAEFELDRWAHRGVGNAWLKPILVSTYGVLAVNASRTTETMYGQDRSGRNKDRCSWPAADLLLYGYLAGNTRGNRVEPAVTNVLHRALIESATRTESLGFANYLSDQGYRILMIHVDGLIVEEDEDLDDVPQIDPWRFKTYLTGLEFLDEQSFTSVEMTRMPGRPLKSRRMVSSRPPKYEPGLLLPLDSDYE